MLSRFFVSGLTAMLLATSPLVLAQPEHEMQLAASSVPRLHSSAALVVNAQTGEVLFGKNTDRMMSIASITKLMTAMVMLDSGQPLDELITISEAEIDRLKNTSSRLAVGSVLSRREMLLLALMSSENRAAASLARTSPGGTSAFVSRMNQKARQLGMHSTRFYDPTGLDSRNTSTAEDLARMVAAAYRYPLIREDTTTIDQQVYARNRMLQYRNSNALVREGQWQIGLSKTGYTQEAGRCLVMMATVGSTPLIMVFLDSEGSSARINDARNIKTWLEKHPATWLAG
ncbi:serine hydrolase [Laribacter hongkongensis]|uniref:serine hydrolase n=1 Tax=Laribacter hongkongensis TaxID=168471 RepID=UPI001EFE06E9|nr:serine hydrolase [Laribacter hongkongensis]MCG9080795.1 serine hydrolase [Laribacter hongkongensis]